MVEPFFSGAMGAETVPDGSVFPQTMIAEILAGGRYGRPPGPEGRQEAKYGFWAIKKKAGRVTVQPVYGAGNANGMPRSFMYQAIPFARVFS